MRFDTVRYLSTTRTALTRRMHDACNSLSAGDADPAAMLRGFESGKHVRHRNWGLFCRVATPIAEARNVLEDAIGRELSEIDRDIGSAVVSLKKSKRRA